MLKGPSEVDGKKIHQVAFVFDDARYEQGDVPKDVPPDDVFAKVELSELDRFSIPREIIFANYHQDQEKLDNGTNRFAKYRDLMKGLLERWNKHQQAEGQAPVSGRSMTEPETTISWRNRPDEWMQDYEPLKALLKHLCRESCSTNLTDDRERSATYEILA